MEKEITSKIFIIEDYCSKENMEEHIKEYIRKLKNDYPTASITREFYKGNNVLVRATEINNKEDIKQKETLQKEKDDWYIRQRGE